ncbi:MAG: hypothetical protein IKS92_13940 [Victivallales bacterium]|nr:hypothetical protein [Victivallales bacterium]MBR4372147.1 hypothetical protein [Victivallales bacterium]MBR5078422.1 hypothetical protein [Victivallales bacterium]
MLSPLNTRKKRNASQTSAIVLKSLLTVGCFDQGGIGKGLRLLGGSSRFAQVQTTSCGSLKSMVCWLGGSSRFAQVKT